MGALSALRRVLTHPDSSPTSEKIGGLAAQKLTGVKRFPRTGHYLRSSNSSARGVSVNLVHGNLPIEEQSAAAASQVLGVLPLGPRIERCEFEQLLQRAMEILNARDVTAQLKKTA